MRKVVIKAVVIGAITDIVSTNIAAIPLVFYVISDLAHAGVPKEKATAAVIEAIHSSPLYFSISIALGGLCSMLGGYVSARIAKHDEILNGAFASFLCVASGVYGLFSPDKSASVFEHLAFLPLGSLLSTAGGYLRARQTHSLK